MTEITINRTCAIIDRCEQFTSGRVGARIKFSFSSEWAGLNKTAVFTNGDTTIDVLNVTDECIIPHEVLAISGKKLKVGVYGFTADDNGNIEIAIPTVYAELGKVVKGADPSGDESTEPSLPVWAQLQDEINDLDDRVTELEQHGGGGEGTSDHRQLTNRDAANQHPISAITGLQSALDGKQASGDYATSGELDALADIVDGKADAADIPSLDGYATEAYVQNYHDSTKQDTITDLATIRSGAALGATALQSVPNTYALKTDIPTSLEDMDDWAAVTDVTVSSVVYHTFWKVAPTATNQVYGWTVHPTNGKLYYIYNNKGAYTAGDYSASTNTQMRTYRTATNVEVPIGAFSTGTTASAWAEPSLGSYKAAYGVVCNDTSKRVTMNPSTGKITFNGEVGGAGFEAAVNALIDVKLGVIENGSY